MPGVKLKAKDAAEFRRELWEKQDRRCALSGYTIRLEDAVLDHDHRTGHIRGVLHKGVNALLGKFENNFKRYGLPFPVAVSAMGNLRGYVDRDYSDMPIYHLHKTTEDKRLRRNKLARARRAAAKETK